MDEQFRRFKMQIPQSVCELLATGPLDHLTTVNPDGSPQVTVVRVGIDNDEFVMGHLGMWKKVQNIRRAIQESRCQVSPNTNAQGLRESLVVYGGARITEGGAPIPSCSSAWRTFTWGQTASFLRRDCRESRVTSHMSLPHRCAESDPGWRADADWCTSVHDLFKNTRSGWPTRSCTPC